MYMLWWMLIILKDVWMDTYLIRNMLCIMFAFCMFNDMQCQVYLHAHFTIATSRCLNNMLPPSIWSCVWTTCSKDLPPLYCLGEVSTFSVGVCILLLPLQDVWITGCPQVSGIMVGWHTPKTCPRALYRSKTRPQAFVLETGWWIATNMHPYWSYIWFTFVWYFLF